MKFLILLFSDQNEFQSQKIFPSASGVLKSACDRSMEWANALSLTSSPPPWPSSIYRVTLIQQNGHWKINMMTLLGTVNE